MASRVHMKVLGRVQGVFYRQSTVDQARVLGLRGWVANESDGTVIIEAEGERDKLESFIIWCQKGPANAKVSDVQVEWFDEVEPQFNRFEIRR
ncbi:MAG: acylphosphatase [Candidatus Obscuribacterales bacterium]|nr:acylphosphatase [Candidatus Obscuribacterales bacterium]